MPTASDLTEFVKRNRRFVKLKNGEALQGVFRGFKVYPSRFDPEKETVGYQIQPAGSDKTILWENSSTKVAELMAKISVGEEIVIKRSGTSATDTKYEIVPVGTAQEE